MEVSEAEEGIDSDFEDEEESDRKRQAAVVSLLEQYEKDRSKVKFGKRIGDGASGTVYEVFQTRFFAHKLVLIIYLRTTNWIYVLIAKGYNGWTTCGYQKSHAQCIGGTDQPGMCSYEVSSKNLYASIFLNSKKM